MSKINKVISELFSDVTSDGDAVEVYKLIRANKEKVVSNITLENPDGNEYAIAVAYDSMPNNYYYVKGGYVYYLYIQDKNNLNDKEMAKILLKRGTKICKYF